MMAEPLSDHEAALAAIRQAGLKHPDGPLLKSFVDEAVDRDRAAAFLLERLSRDNDTNTSEPATRAFLSDWKHLIALFLRDPVPETLDKSVTASVRQRDGGKCCITGMPGSFWDPLVVVPIFPRIKPADIETSSCHEMLEAFLTPDLRDRLLSETEKNSDDHVENHWLLRRSAAVAFSQGYFQLSFIKSRRSKYELSKVWTGGPHYPAIFGEMEDFSPGSFIDSSSSNIKIPSRWALEILSHFATPLRWTYAAQEIAAKQRQQPYAALPSPFSPALSFLSDACATIFKTVWLLAPGTLRIRAYRGLASLGERMYGLTDSFSVTRLPFGLYLKTATLARRGRLVNEHATLELVRRHMDLPVPRPLDLVSDSREVFLLTTRIPGYMLGHCIDVMSDEDTATLVRDLRRHMVALRALPRPRGWKHAISNAVDGPCFDHRINAGLDYDEARGEVLGPFLSEDDFNDALRCGALPGVVHGGGHEMVFAHGDLNMRNILVDERGKLAGIVDWETAGWYPEYWDYTKALFVTRWHKRWLGMVDDVFGQFGDFTRELATERELWEYCF